MKKSFYIEENRLEELKDYIKKNTKTVRFIHNPIKEGDDYCISLELDIKESGVLNSLFEKWHKEDNQIKEEKPSYFKIIISILSIIIIWLLPIILSIFTDNYYYLFSYVIWYIPATIITALLVVNIAKNEKRFY